MPPRSTPAAATAPGRSSSRRPAIGGASQPRLAGAAAPSIGAAGHDPDATGRGRSCRRPRLAWACTPTRDRPAHPAARPSEDAACGRPPRSCVAPASTTSRTSHLDLPRDALIVFTGLSGSGKSSLAFDTIFAEGQRRYVESLSAYARQFLGQMDKPDVDFIEGLSPAVSIDQKSTSRTRGPPSARSPRSTTTCACSTPGSARPHCPVCGEPIARQTPQQIVDRVLELTEGTRFQVLAPVIRERKGEYADLFADLQTKGYAGSGSTASVHPLTEPPTLKKQEKHTIEVVVDRLAVKASGQAAAHRLGRDRAAAGRRRWSILDFVDLPEDDPHRERTFSEHLACPNDDLLASTSSSRARSRSTRRSAPARTAPASAPAWRSTPSWSSPTRSAALDEGAIAPWAGGARPATTSCGCSRALADDAGLRPRHAVGAGCRPRRRRRCCTGIDDQVHVRYTNRYGRERSYYAELRGRRSRAIERRYAEAESDYAPRAATRATCARCRARPATAPGSSPRSLAVTVGGRSIAERRRAADRRGARLPARARADRPRGADRRAGAQGDQRAAAASCSTSAWTTSRSTAPPATLAGGEAQRIRLATQIGSGLVGVLYVLDEPSHRPAPARQPPADRDAGPAARPRQHADRRRARRGHHPHRRLGRRHRPGRRRARRPGRRLRHRSTTCWRRRTRSPARTCRAGARSRCPTMRRPGSTGRELVVDGAREHNLRDIDVSLPARLLRRGHRRQRLGQVHAGQRHPVRRRWRDELNGARPVPGPAHAGRPASSSVDKVVARRPVARSGARRAPTRRPTPAFRPHPQAVRRDAPRPRSAATSRAGSRSTSRAGAARPAPATARSRSR